MLQPLRRLIGPIQIKRKGLTYLAQQLSPRARHLDPLNTVLAEVDFLAIERVRVPYDGGVSETAGAI